LAEVVEKRLPESYRITHNSPGQGKGRILVIRHPFGLGVRERNKEPATIIGYHFYECPAVLYIAGSDEEGTKAAVYDLIQRLWRDKDVVH